MRSPIRFLVWSLVQNLTSLLLTLVTTVVLAFTTVLTLALTVTAATFFREATDPARMRAVVERYLRVPGGRPVEVLACQVEYARRGSPRTVIEYKLTLRDPVSGRQWSQAASGIAYGRQRTQKVWQRVRDQHSELPASRAVLSRAAYVPELDLLLQVFPFDHQLPALEPLMAGPLPGLIEPLLATFGPGEWQVAEWAAECVRYRVDLRASVRLTVRARETGTGETAERHFFAKTYGSGERAERASSVQRDVAAALAAGDEPFAIAPLVAYLPDDWVLVQGEVQGPSLLEVHRETTIEGVIDAVRRTARALAALHQLPVAAPPHRVELGRTDSERLRRNAERLRAARPELAPLVTEVEDGIRAGLAAIAEFSSVPVHGDLKPSHVRLDGERVILLDLDKFAAGEPMVDVTNLLFHLRRRGSSVTRAFIEEYFRHVPGTWEQRLVPYYAWDLLTEASSSSKSGKEALGGLKSDRAKREKRLNSLLTEAQAVLAGQASLWSSQPDRIHGKGDRRAARRARSSSHRARGGT